MSEEDFAKAVRSLMDEDVRAKVAGGDFLPFAGLELTDEQRGLLEGAATDFPEVVGNDLHLTLLGVHLNPTHKVNEITQDVTVNKAKTADKAFTQMDDYIRG